MDKIRWYNDPETKKKFIPTAISALGYNRHWPVALRYGKHPYGGLQLKSCKVEAHVLKIKGLKKLLCKTETSKILKKTYYTGSNMLLERPFQS